MKNGWFRLGIVAGVLAVVFAGASALADRPGPQDTTRCKDLQYYCTRTCAESPYTGFGLCQEGNGRGSRTSPISVQCCCCTEGWQHRSYIGG